jgi:ferredoxin
LPARQVKGADKKGIYQAEASLDEREDNEAAAANCPVKVIKILGGG